MGSSLKINLVDIGYEDWKWVKLLQCPVSELTINNVES
jgi:hypothetical protein